MRTVAKNQSVIEEENDFFSTSKVYIQIDEESRIIRCDGGYSIGNIDNLDEWILIDEGYGDKYNLCQNHYFNDGLYTNIGIPKYKYENNKILERTEQEIQKDIDDIPPAPPTLEQRLNELEDAYTTLMFGEV